MRFLTLASVFGLALASPLQVDLTTASIPTQKEAAAHARQLLHSNSLATLSTVFPDGDPIGLLDYYTDCSTNGSPTLLSMSIATTFRNVASGSKITLSLREKKEDGGEWGSVAAHPRLAIMGTLVDVPEEEVEATKECFVGRHHDAKWWTPGNRIHKSKWVRMEVEKVYWVGGFGNVAYIGWIPKDIWEGVETEDDVLNKTMEEGEGEL